MEQIQLRVFKDTDILPFEQWLHQDYVAQWYEQPSAWMDEVRQRDGAFRFIHHFIAVYEGVDIGFGQYYAYEKSGEDWHGAIETAGTYSMDYLIGERAYLKKSLGTSLVKALLTAIFQEPDAQRVIVQPEAENRASCNTLRSAGFQYDEENRLYLFLRV
ncbi:GNAT family N-acetyltransferase [Anaeromassilibacillus senegalensis]|uniref:GNAT family N-acetyltransferase n=1 Tax=Anaeromassilibacillus senegalensis TaxID=1673717 RepID=UPI000681A060|nr:GNAT family N-acetyltransferase [Anaeromassilibacillus senegalensis]